MYTQRRYKFGTVINWTRREIIFFTIFVTAVTCIYELFDLKWLQVPLAPVALIGTAVAFMVGFQNNAAYDRIWEARKIWGGIVNVSRTFTITVRDSFYLHNKDKSADESETVKQITNRHIAWLTALRYAMRTKKEWEAEYEWSKHEAGTKKHWYGIPEIDVPLEKELEPLLSKEEFDFVMSQSHKPNAIIALQSKHLRKLTDEDKIWDFSLLNLQQMLQEMTALQGKSERIKNFPYPKQYGSIGYHFVHIFMWLLPMAIIPEFAKIGANLTTNYPESFKLIADNFVWINIPFTVIVIWVFNTMLRIGLAGENPFEGSPNDVPISNISRGITRDILQLIDEDPEQIPDAYENSGGIQM